MSKINKIPSEIRNFFIEKRKDNAKALEGLRLQSLIPKDIPSNETFGLRYLNRKLWRASVPRSGERKSEVIPRVNKTGEQMYLLCGE